MKLKETALLTLRITEDQLFLGTLALDLIEGQVTREEAAERLLERAMALGEEAAGITL
jgi:hypothetical protein